MSVCVNVVIGKRSDVGAQEGSSPCRSECSQWRELNLLALLASSPPLWLKRATEERRDGDQRLHLPPPSSPSLPDSAFPFNSGWSLRLNVKTSYFHKQMLMRHIPVKKKQQKPNLLHDEIQHDVFVLHVKSFRANECMHLRCWLA